MFVECIPIFISLKSFSERGGRIASYSMTEKNNYKDINEPEGGDDGISGLCEETIGRTNPGSFAKL